MTNAFWGRVQQWQPRFPIGGLLFLFFLSIYIFTMSGTIHYRDEVEKYRVAQSIVDRHELSIRPAPTRNVVGLEGESYSIYELGQTVLQIPLYIAGRILYAWFPLPDLNVLTILVVGLLNPILTALTCVLLFKTARSFGFQEWTSLLVTGVFGLATIAFPYSRGFTREPLLAFLILFSIFAAVHFAKTRQLKWLPLTGLALGYLVFTKFLQGIIIPLVLVYVIAAILRQHADSSKAIKGRAVIKGLALLFAPIFVFLGLAAIYSLARFGALTGMAGKEINLLDGILFELRLSHPLEAIVGLLFSPEKGIFLYSPPVLLFPFVWFKWYKQFRLEAVLFLGIILLEYLAAITRYDWTGGSWWGPRYLVQLTPLLILPIGVIESFPSSTRRLGKFVLAALFAIGLFVQMVAAFSNEREYLDITNADTSLLGQIDFIRHHVIDSIVIYLSPIAPQVQMNPYGIVLLGCAVWSGWLLIRRMSFLGDEKRFSRVGWTSMVLITAVLVFGFINWLVAPYQNVLAARANTRFAAADYFLADGRRCEAVGMYIAALDWQTTYQSEAIGRLGELDPPSRGKVIALDDMMHWVDVTGDAKIENDPTTGIADAPSLRFSTPSNQNASVLITSSPVDALPNATYELSGWLKSSSIYGMGFGVVSIFEDNGNWENSRSTDVAAIDETHGWQSFRTALTLLPTTKRLFIKMGLYNTFGTLWVDGIQLVELDARPPQPSRVMPPCK